MAPEKNQGIGKMIEDKNNIETDLMMRSILKSGQEEVPAHVWEGVSAGLDKAARRRVVALWWRRSAIGGAIAAAVAAVLVLNTGKATDDIISGDTGNGLIAVVEPGPAPEGNTPETVLIAQAKPVSSQIADIQNTVASVQGSAAARLDAAADRQEVVTDGKNTAAEDQDTVTEVIETQEHAEVAYAPAEAEPEDEQVYFPEDWGEDEETKSAVKTSVVLSGLTGTNSSQNAVRKNLIKRPTIAKAPTKTGVKETSTNSTYGIPLSFGVGAKIDFTPKWSLGIGVNYTLLTRKFYGEYQKVNAEGILVSSSSSDVTNSQHYIGIPVNAYYNIVNSRNVNFYAYAGGAVEKCVGDKYALQNTAITHTEIPAGVQLSANLGIGAEFMIGKHLGLYIDPSLRYYFNNRQPKSIRTAQPFMLGFEMGMRVRL